MCILFLLIGDENSPTVICNNRDEYLTRATVRGSLIDNGNTYCPVDKVGGGSWLSFSGLNGNQLKFAVVLNFHYWRQPNVVPLTNEELLKSRGLLIKNFMESNIESLTYAQSVYDTRTEYRPFNLIVGDHTGCYYVSRDHRQTCPRRLESGKVYGLSNGYIDDSWQKVSTGVSILSNDLLPSLLPALSQSVDALRPSADTLMRSLLQVDTPLDDPDLGNRSEAITVLGGIFVKPCLIYRRTPADNANSEKVNSTNNASATELEVSWDDATSQRMFQMRLDAVLQASSVLPEGYQVGRSLDDRVGSSFESILPSMMSFWAKFANLEEKVHYVLAMRVLGGFLLCLGIAELSLGLYIFSFLKNVHLGSWWGAVCVVVCGFLGFSSKNRNTVIGGCAVSTFGLIVAAVAIVLDGMAVSSFQGLVACANTETGVYYGSHSALQEIRTCARDEMFKQPGGGPPTTHRPYVASASLNDTVIRSSYYFNNYYYNHPYYNGGNFYYNHPYYGSNYNNFYYNHPYYNFYQGSYYNYVVNVYGNRYYYGHHPAQTDDNFHPEPVCVCTDSSLCYDYTLSHGSDCGSILTTYTNDLVSSTALLSVSFLVLLIYCVVAFSSACYSGNAKVLAGNDDIQLTSLQHRESSSPPQSNEMPSPAPTGSAVRYAVPYMVQPPQQSPSPQRGQPSVAVPNETPSPGPVVPQYVQLGSADRPVYILQMYAPSPGAPPLTAPMFMEPPQFVSRNSDSHMFMSKESSFHSG